jgi:hypothetical protein
MSDTEVLDAEVVEQHEHPGQEVIPAPGVTVAPQVDAQELVDRLARIKEAQEKAMVRDVDYGVIPGTNKPTLLKPGAEKLSVLFQFDVQLTNEQTWGPGDHLTVISRATVFHIPTGARMGYGEGLCTTREKKYAKRQAQLVCPHCGESAVIKGKAEYGGGWLCWAKRGGCGAKFSDGDQAIDGQSRGDVENPDLPDTWNTVLKMAEKRARIDAILAVTGASALFTQDLDDHVEPAPGPETEQPPAESPPPKKASRDQVQTLGALYRDGTHEGFLAALDTVDGGSTEAVDKRVVALTYAQAAQLIEQLGGKA